MKQRLIPNTKQEQILSQVQKQSLSILAMNQHELYEFLMQEQMENPVLTVEGQISYVPHTDNNSLYEIPDIQNQSLADYLWEQVEMERWTKTEQKKLYFIFTLLDEDTGYLKFSTEKVAEILKISINEAETYIGELKKMEPAGIGAKDVRESLLLQLQRRGKLASGLEKMINTSLEEAARGAYGAAARKCGITATEAERYVELIKTLNPRPVQGLSLKGQKEHTIVPEIKAEFQDGQWKLTMYEGSSFNLSIDEFYSDMAKGTKDKLVSTYLKEKMGRAGFLQAAVERRRKTIIRITAYLLEQQKDAILNNKNYKEITMEEIAEVMELHASTISRALKEKYIAFSDKVIPVRQLLTGGVKGNVLILSPEKQRIKQIIREENPHHPYSDQQISMILCQEKMSISRRTVAKYREELMIANARDRKR